MSTVTLRHDRVRGPSEPPEETPRRIHRLAVALAVLTYAVALLGGGVNSTDSTLADPHWPSFGGSWLPDLSRMLEHPGLLLEHAHRVLVSIVGLGAIALAVLLARNDPRRWVRRLGVSACVLVLIPAILGGLTVLLGKSPVLSVIHNALAMLLIAGLTALAVATGPGWFAEAAVLPRRPARSLLGFAAAAAIAIWLQVVLGGVPRHATADFGGPSLVLIGDAIHILWAFVVFAVVVVAYLEVGRVRSAAREDRARVEGLVEEGTPPVLARVLRPALGLVLLLVVQLFLGIVAFAAQPKTPPSVDELAAAATASRAEAMHSLTASAHQAAGVLMLVVAVVFLLRATRLLALARPPDPASSGSVIEEASW